jgi:uncharacterized RDD family membrane protein YckC
MAGAQERCPACGANVNPMTEGALAPDPARARPEPLREIPGLKKKEKTWKDEVRERMRDRKRRRGEDEDLPLFRDDMDGEAEGGSSGTGEVAEPSAPPSRPPIVIAPRIRAASPPVEPLPPPAPVELGADEPDLPLRPPADLPLRPPAAAHPEPEMRVGGDDPAPRARTSTPMSAPLASADEWTLGAEPGAAASRPVERPAYFGERAQAAVLDLALLTVMWAIVVYFACRAAHVDLAGLRPAWPYLGSYLAFLGLTYAGYFTGTTGQTLGKIATGLRVVDTEGRPPGYLRALLRAALGSLGVLAAGAGLVPILLDPARRGFHDRLVKTRVVKH